MKKAIVITLAALTVCIAGVAVAVPAERVDMVLSVMPQWFRSGIYVSGARIEPVKRNKVTKILANTAIYDFGGLSTVELGTPCADSDAITVTGAGFGDTCSMGLDQVISDYASLSCFVSAANAVKVRACAFQTDGGEVDLPDASYTVRVISSQ